MRAQSIHDNWRVKHLDEENGWREVTLPDDAMLREPRTADALGGLNVSWFEGRDYLYSKTIAFKEEELAKHYVLEFEGVYRNAEVIINNRSAGSRPYGYTNFYVDCDEFLREGENTIQVIVRNADQPNSRWYSGAGIYRPVKLWSSGKNYIELNGVKIRTLSLNPAKIEVTVKTNVDGPVRIEISGGETLIASAEGTGRCFDFELPEVKPWSPDSPCLYTCKVKFADDEAVESFGVRTLNWGNDGILINGERVILRGACVHHDNGLLGAVCDPDALERRIRILKENGYNALRSAHNPCSKTALEICDRLGMMVMDEYIDHWYIHKRLQRQRSLAASPWRKK